MMRSTLLAAILAVGPVVAAQQPIATGNASYAAYPPAYKARTDEHAGFNASRMLTRHIYADEIGSDGAARPIPTNDWWTDLLNNRFSGGMWSYPAMLRTAADGVTVAYPTHWSDNGTEVLHDSWLRVGGTRFTAAEARAADWHDWDVVIEMPSHDGKANIRTTAVHGMPFTWFEFNGVEGRLAFSSKPATVATAPGRTMVRIGQDLYGLYYADYTEAEMTSDGMMRLPGTTWLSVALLGAETDFEEYQPYSASVVRSTTVDWDYDERSSLLSTLWTVRAENLREPNAEAPVMQGFLPHAYKHAVTSSIAYTGREYLTPRGRMKMATADDGRFTYSYRFAGMLPYYAAPAEGDVAENGYRPEVMRKLMEDYAARGGFGGDTYWGGKGLTQMALNMTFAKETGHTDIYEQSRARLREALTDWLTYTPGEETRFFSYYPRWGGMLGFDVSYDSDTFNDHHFHYGYFIYAAALLCLEDPSFAAGYGEMLRMIVKDYANYDRTDTRFPFLRTLDPWAGHSYAGGLGDHVNDNGNGQESSSEAMQGWGGVYMLGVALNDKEMRDAGIFGWLTESRATAEYWFDRDHIYTGRDHNYDYTRYASPYNTNITSKGIGWWTWFSGDPLWMHSIQWMPVSPCLNYLSEDLDFVRWDYETMKAGTAYDWFENNGDADALGHQSVGNVVLCYMERYDPAGAAAIFDEALAREMEIAKGIDTGHISYFVIHSHLTHGDIDFEVSADIPTANAYRRNDGTYSYMVYNPDAADRTVHFSRGGATVATVTAPGHRLTVFTEPAAPADATITSADGFILPPGSRTALSGTVYDQYGAQAVATNAVWTATGGATVTSDGFLTIPGTTPLGSKITVTYAASGVNATATVTVNPKPHTVGCTISGIPDFTETGRECRLEMAVTDQYGSVTVPEASWSVTAPDGSAVNIENGILVPERAGRYHITATAGSDRADATLAVVPPLTDVARGATAISSSEENAGTLTGNVNDGDLGSRWGSAHTDNEWILVDLGADHRLSSVTLDWEAAYAADYDIEVAPDGCATTSHTGNYAGVTRTYTVPADNAWTTVFSRRGNTSAGRAVHPLSAVGRYVRVRCITRGTAYGYSLLEMAVGGIIATAGPDAVAGLDIAVPAVIMEGSPTAITVRAITLDGSVAEAGKVTWSCSPEGTFDNGTFTPSTYGFYTLSASSGTISASTTTLAEESVKLKSISAEPATVAILTGDAATISVNGLDQFGGIYPLDTDNITVTIRNATGNAVTPAEASFDITSGLFTASVRGDYTIDLGGLASVKATVRDVAEANLAAGKSASSSSYNGGNTASNVTDLDTDTRWESDTADGEWIAIDLGKAFVLNRVVLRWEGAYASAYAIQTSMDGERWFTVYETTAGRGGIEEVALPSVPATHVRLWCLRRATVWGNSLYEIEVYGPSRFDATDNGTAPEITPGEITTGNGSVSGSVEVSHPTGTVFTDVTVHDATGARVASLSGYGSPVHYFFDGLGSGDYTLVFTAEDPFGNTASLSRDVEVKYSIDGINLALGKPATATTSENDGIGASKAVDGDRSTRWGSQFNDNEAITVDLLALYRIHNVVIYWNSPAYATHYTVETSADGNNFTPVIARENWDGNTDSAIFESLPARYVRVTGHRRATPYGTSIDELEVYGKDDPSLSSVMLTADDAFTADVYNLQGVCIMRGATAAEARHVLAPGLYIHGNRKLVVR